MNSKFFLFVYTIGVLGSSVNIFNSNSYEERLGWCTSFFFALSSLLCQIELNYCKKKNNEKSE